MQRKDITLLLLVFSLLFGLCGCGATENDGVTLWVLTEQSASDGMNLQAKIIAERMEEKYDNLTIQLDILPTDEKSREVLLKQLRNQIMTGSGPDVFLLPVTDSLTTDYVPGRTNVRKTMQLQIEPLFCDVTQIMRNRLFADLQAYYVNDAALEKESLKTEVMDAGVLDGKRYILPLRFDIPVILTTPEDGARTGLSSKPEDGAITLVKTALSQEDTAMLTGLRLPNDLSWLPRLLDYQAGQVLLTAEQLAENLRVYQAWKSVNTKSAQALFDIFEEKNVAAITSYKRRAFSEEEARTTYAIERDLDAFNKIVPYASLDQNWHAAGLPLFTSRLSDTLETLSIAKYAGFDVEMYPLRAMDGSVVASVAYYGAVGCGCENPALAYEFLREFLTEEFQWDIYRPRGSRTLSAVHEIEADPQTPGQVEDSWPVRTAGSVPYLWDTLQYQNKNGHYSFKESSASIVRKIRSIKLTDDDLPALNWPIDEVRFPVFMKKEESIEYALSLLNEEDGTPTDADIDALAEQVYQNLCYHLAEG